MALIKHDIPILEYDDNPNAVIMPRKENLLSFPTHAVFPFLGDEIDCFAHEHGCKLICELESATKPFPIYRYTHKGREVCICQAPVGAPAAVQILDFLIGCGVKYIISAGSCGALKSYEENQFLIPTEALRDEGTSYHYLPPSRTVTPDLRATDAIKRTLNEYGIQYEECKTWTTDAFYRETKDMVEYRKAEGYTVVEMECASLFACAKFRGVHFAQLLYTADSLANVELYDTRNWGKASMSIAMRLCLDSVVKLKNNE